MLTTISHIKNIPVMEGSSPPRSIYWKQRRYKQWFKNYKEDQIREAWQHQKVVKFVNYERGKDGLFNPGSLSQIAGEEVKKLLYRTALSNCHHYLRTFGNADPNFQKYRDDCNQLKTEDLKALINRARSFYHD